MRRWLLLLICAIGRIAQSDADSDADSGDAQETPDADETPSADETPGDDEAPDEQSAPGDQSTPDEQDQQDDDNRSSTEPRRPRIAQKAPAAGGAELAGAARIATFCNYSLNTDSSASWYPILDDRTGAELRCIDGDRLQPWPIAKSRGRITPVINRGPAASAAVAALGHASG
jgi:hypothetical protein